MKTLPLPRRADRYAICFVCTGNICRSPMAAVVLASLVVDPQIEISSAGTGPWHAGESMDPRASDALAARGYADPGHRAQHVSGELLRTLDLVVALDRSHEQTLRGLAGGTERIRLLRGFDSVGGGAMDVPDPYYDDDAFDPCLELIERGCRGLAQTLEADRTVRPVP